MAQHGDTLPLMERVLDLESKLEKQQETMEKLREEATEAKLQEAVKTTEYRVREEMTPKPAPEAISEEQLVALQARLDGLHVTKLLTDEVSMLRRVHVACCPQALRKTDVCLAGAVRAGRPRRGLR